MSLFRPGPLPPGFIAQRPSWPSFQLSGLQLPEERPGQTAHLPAVSIEAELNQARMEASRILQEAAAEAEAAVAAAKAEGFEQGCQEGFAAGQAELELQRRQMAFEEERIRIQVESMRQTAEAEARAIQAQAEARAQELLRQASQEAAAIMAGARDEQQRRLDAAQAAIVELAVAAATRLVQGHLAIQPASVVHMVSAGLQRLKDTNCLVRVNPEDLPLLEAQRRLLEKELGAGLLQLQADVGMSQGSYVVSSPQGGIDGRVEHQAQLLRAALSAALGGGEP